MSGVLLVNWNYIDSFLNSKLSWNRCFDQLSSNKSFASSILRRELQIFYSDLTTCEFGVSRQSNHLSLVPLPRKRNRLKSCRRWLSDILVTTFFWLKFVPMPYPCNILRLFERKFSKHTFFIKFLETRFEVTNAIVNDRIGV